MVTRVTEVQIYSNEELSRTQQTHLGSS